VDPPRRGCIDRESGWTIGRELGAESAQSKAIEPESNRVASGECCGAGALAAEPAAAGEGGAAGDVVGSTDRSAEARVRSAQSKESRRVLGSVVKKMPWS